jgi:hypothetical protein
MVSTKYGNSVLTGGHKIYVDFVSRYEVEFFLKKKSPVMGVVENNTQLITLDSIIQMPNRLYMYDLTTEDYHNFVLNRTKLLVHNSPDRNYHFSPPNSQDALNKQTRVFGYIWTDEELLEALERGVDVVNLYPPQTGFTLNGLTRNWYTIVLTAAAVQALTSLSICWVNEEFSAIGSEIITIKLNDNTELSLSLEELYDIIFSENFKVLC